MIHTILHINEYCAVAPRQSHPLKTINRVSLIELYANETRESTAFIIIVRVRSLFFATMRDLVRFCRLIGRRAHSSRY